ncbi:MAG: DUF1501 domain-containing protein, partial [Pirellulales bacterium]
MRKPLCSGPVRRRDFVRVGALGLGGLGMADLLAMRASAAAPDRSDTSIIFVWLPGGPPHLDTYDMKPDAPAEYRGPFRPIKTCVSGMEICELFPEQAKVADRFNIIRSISHEFADHGGGHKRFITARVPREPTGTVNDAPAVGSIVAKQREHIRRGVPNYVAATDAGRGGVDVFAFGASYLGSAYTPFTVTGNPNASSFQVQDLSVAPAMESRLGQRAELLRGLDRFRREVDTSGSMSALDQFNQKALEMLTGPEARRAFDLSLENDAIRDKYGRHPYGQRCLLARRL